MKWFYLKNHQTNEIMDIIAKSLNDAKLKAIEMLGGTITDYIERF